MYRPITVVSVAVALAAPAALAQQPITPLPPRLIELHNFANVDFPRRLEALDSALLFAQHELRFAELRADSYQPFRSFGRYAATLMADQVAQLELIAARQRLECLRRERAVLWQRRQQIVATLLLVTPPPQPH
jgi:hypothetical protein